MNIFYFNHSPITSAEEQPDKMLVKMPLETAQMLCTAHHCYGDKDQVENVPYKQAHLNHPSTIWTRRSKSTYMWLYNHMIALGDEYKKRYGKTHLSITKCKDFLAIPPRHIQGDDWCQPPQAMPDEYKTECSIQAYWNYYIGEKHVVVNHNKEKPYEQRPQETY